MQKRARKSKRLLAILLSLAMCISLLPSVALAADTYSQTATLEDGGVYLIVANGNKAMVANDGGYYDNNNGEYRYHGLAAKDYTNGVTEVTSDMLWKIEVTSGKMYIKNGDNYLNATYSSTSTPMGGTLSLGEKNDSWTLSGKTLKSANSGKSLEYGNSGSSTIFAARTTGSDLTFYKYESQSGEPVTPPAGNAVYTLTDSFEMGKTYLIVNTNNGAGVALTNTSSNSFGTANVTVSGSKIVGGNELAAAEWEAEATSSTSSSELIGLYNGSNVLKVVASNSSSPYIKTSDTKYSAGGFGYTTSGHVSYPYGSPAKDYFIGSDGSSFKASGSESGLGQVYIFVKGEGSSEPVVGNQKISVTATSGTAATAAASIAVGETLEISLSHDSRAAKSFDNVVADTTVAAITDGAKISVASGATGTVKVTGLKDGVTTITCTGTSSSGSAYTAIITLTVGEGGSEGGEEQPTDKTITIEATKTTTNETQATIAVGETLTVNYWHGSGEAKNFANTVGDDTVAVITAGAAQSSLAQNATGTVTIKGLKAGTTDITLTGSSSSGQGSKYIAVIRLTVTGSGSTDPVTPPAPTGTVIELTPDHNTTPSKDVTIVAGEKFTVKLTNDSSSNSYTFVPDFSVANIATAEPGSVTIASKATGSMEFTGIAAGSTTITFTAENTTRTAVINLTVKAPASDKSIDVTASPDGGTATAEIAVGETLAINVTHASGEAKNFTNTVADETVAKINSGASFSLDPNAPGVIVVEGLKAGTTTINCTGASAGTGRAYKATITVTVTAPPAPVTETTYLAFTSDAHNKGGNTSSATRLSSWLDTVSGKLDATFADMGMCGDMADANASESDYWNLAKTVMDTVATSNKVDGDGFFVCGNHEWAPGNFSGTSNSVQKARIQVAGSYDVESAYVIYSFGATSSSDSGTGFQSADITALDNYLDDAPTDRPIFILSHFPLHSYNSGWSRSTANAGQVITVLNEAAESGHTIIFLWGHNHTLSDTNYDQIITDKIGTTNISFTYAAAGCMSDSEYGTGSHSVSGKGLVAAINGTDVVLSYYDANGNVGATGTATKGGEGGQTPGGEDVDPDVPTGDVVYKLVDSFVLDRTYLIVSVNDGQGKVLTSSLSTENVTVADNKITTNSSMSASEWKVASANTSAGRLGLYNGNKVLKINASDSSSPYITTEEVYNYGGFTYTANRHFAYPYGGGSGSETTYYFGVKNGSFDASATESGLGEVYLFEKVENGSEGGDDPVNPPAEDDVIEVTPTASNSPVESKTINVGESFTVRVTNGSTQSAYSFKVSFSSNGIASADPATVNIGTGATEDIVITGVKAGTVTVTIANDSQYSQRKATISLTVVGEGGDDPVTPPAEDDVIEVTPTTSNPTQSKTIDVGESFTVRVTNGSTRSAYPFKVSFSSNGIASADPATVNIGTGATEDIVITGVKAGTVTVTIYNENSYDDQYTRKATIDLTVVGEGGEDPVTPPAPSGDVTYVAFASDVHNGSGNVSSADRLNGWINKVTTINGAPLDNMGFCGDMGPASGNSFWSNAQSVMDTVTNNSNVLGNGFYVCGNHEYNPGNYTHELNATTRNYSDAGECLETSGYIFYSLGARQWNETYSDADINNMSKFLSEHSDFGGPIFILAHFPLHSYSSGYGYGGSTSGESSGIHDGRPAVGSAKIINVLNEYPNVIFLWGHNHSSSSDHYDVVYTDKINDTEINFTYASAGCMSDTEYTGSSSVRGKGLVAAIYGGSVVLTYYDANGNVVGKPATIEMTGSSTPAVEYTITASAGANGSISPSGAVAVKEGHSKTFTFAPNAGYEVDTVLVNGAAVSVSGNSYTMANISADATISVSFKKIQGTAYTLATEMGAGQYILVSNGYALYNNNGKISAVPVTVSGNSVILSDSNVAGATWTFTAAAGADKSGDYVVKSGDYYFSRVSDGSGSSVAAEITTQQKTSEASGLPYYQWTYDVANGQLKHIGGQDQSATFYAYYDTSANAFYTDSSEQGLKLYVVSTVQPEEPEVHPDVVNKTAEHASYDFVDSKLSVECSEACVVLAKTGSNYTALTAVASGEDAYAFDYSAISGEFTLVIAMKGDADTNGVVDMADATAVMLSWVNDEPLEDAVSNYAVNVDGDNEITMSDATAIMLSWVNETGFSWN